MTEDATVICTWMCAEFQKKVKVYNSIKYFLTITPEHYIFIAKKNDEHKGWRTASESMAFKDKLSSPFSLLDRSSKLSKLCTQSTWINQYISKTDWSNYLVKANKSLFVNQVLYKTYTRITDKFKQRMLWSRCNIVISFTSRMKSTDYEADYV